jgi:hypothetical protein
MPATGLAIAVRCAFVPEGRIAAPVIPEASFGTAVCGLENTVFNVPALASAKVAAAGIGVLADVEIQAPIPAS